MEGLSHIVRGYRDRIQRAGGSVIVSSAGAVAVSAAPAQVITLNLGDAAAPTLTAGQMAVYDRSVGGASYLQSGRGAFKFSRADGLDWAAITAKDGNFTGTLTVSGPGNHTFSGMVYVTGDVDGYMYNLNHATNVRSLLNARREGAYRHRWSLAANNDLICYTLTGLSGAEVSTESFRIVNANGYVGTATRFGVGTATPGYPVHITSTVSNYSILTTGAGWFAAASAVSAVNGIANNVGANGALFRQDAASATTPVVIVKLGATPGSAGDVLKAMDSNDNPLVRLTTVGATAGATELQLLAYGTGVSGILRGYRARGTGAAPTAVQTGDVLLSIGAHGRGATGYSSTSRARIDMVCEENWTDAAHGTNVVIYTTPSGSVTPAVVARLTGGGSLVLGTAALATTATDGFLYIPSSAGAPTGVPTAQTGRVALHYDSTNDNFYIYDGAWLKVGVAA